MRYVDEFWAWKNFGGGVPWSMEAKIADGILLLEEAWGLEQRNEQQ